MNASQNLSRHLPTGIVPVLQTPFDDSGAIDDISLQRLINDAVDSGATGFLVPVVASEVSHLTLEERRTILHSVQRHLRSFQEKGKRPAVIVGASSDDHDICREMHHTAMEINADAWLVAVPQSLYSSPERVVAWFRRVTDGCQLPLVVQDLQFNGNGLELSVIRDLRENIPIFCGIKVETVPAGPKYTKVREAFGREFWIAGGWAVPQMIEALDRGVDAMVPESSMVRVYQSILRCYEQERRDISRRILNELLPILSFTNQELLTSIAFFKRLLVRKQIFSSERMRMPGFEWDVYNLRIADELIEAYLQLEADVAVEAPGNDGRI